MMIRFEICLRRQDKSLVNSCLQRESSFHDYTQEQLRINSLYSTYIQTVCSLRSHADPTMHTIGKSLHGDI